MQVWRRNKGVRGKATDSTDKVTLDIEGQQVTCTNLTKTLYPETRFTKVQVIEYYGLMPLNQVRALAKQMMQEISEQKGALVIHFKRRYANQMIWCENVLKKTA